MKKDEYVELDFRDITIDPNLTRRDGSAFERQYAESTKEKDNPNRHN